MTTIFELAARLQTANAAEELLLLLLKATVILAIARLLLAALPRASAATKHLVATAALVAVGLMPLVTYVVPAWEIAVQPRVQAETAATSKERAAENGRGGRERTIGVRDDEGSSLSTAVAVVKAVAPQPLTALERATTVAAATWKGLIVLTLGFAAFLLLVHMSIGMIGVWYVARNAEELRQDAALQALDEARGQLALPVDIRLLRSSRISVPVLWGLRKPVLLLPPDVVTWPADRLRVVLLHELAHLKRYDGISLILTRIAVSLFWFHPLAWSLERAGRSECERACDDLVLAGGTKPSEYADHLLAIARSMPTFDPFRSVTLAMSRKSQLEGRLLSILQPHVARQVFSGSRVAIACAVAVAVIIPLSAMRLTADPSGPQQVVERKPKVAATIAQAQPAPQSGSQIDVTPHVESLEDYFLAKFGKHGDRFARTPKDADDWYDRAYDYYHADRYEEAAAAFRRAAAGGARPATSLYNAACSYALLGDADRAIPALHEAIAAGWDDVEKIADDSDFDPIRSDPRFARVVKDTAGNVVNRRLTDAMDNYRQLRAGHGDPDDWHSVGLDLLRLRKINESIDAFQKSIEHGSKRSTAMYNIACAYSLGGDVPKGMSMLSQAIDNGFSDEDKLKNDPDIALLRKQPAFVPLLRKAYDLELRGCCQNWKTIDLVTQFLTDWDDSLAHHQRIVQKYPDSGRAWFNLGYAALQTREFDTAIDAYRRTIALGYSVGTSSYNMACAYARKGDRNAAFEWLERARAAKFDLGQHIEDDEDLDSLHGDARWDRLTASLDLGDRPFWKY